MKRYVGIVLISLLFFSLVSPFFVSSCVTPPPVSRILDMTRESRDGNDEESDLSDEEMIEEQVKEYGRILSDLIRQRHGLQRELQNRAARSGLAGASALIITANELYSAPRDVPGVVAEVAAQTSGLKDVVTGNGDTFNGKEFAQNMMSNNARRAQLRNEIERIDSIIESLKTRVHSITGKEMTTGYTQVSGRITYNIPNIPSTEDLAYMRRTGRVR